MRHVEIHPIIGAMRQALRIGIGISILTAAGLAAQGKAAPKRSELEIAGGKVAVRYYAMPLPARSLERHQRKGTVWSMSDHEAAVLETDVALMVGKVLIPPGEHRLSTWYKKKGEWQLLIFHGPKNFKSGTPYKSLKLQIRDLDSPESEMLKIEVVESRRVIRLNLYGGTTRLRVTLEPLRVVKHEGTLAGRPATYEFYEYTADYRVQGRLRNLELVHFGRVRTKGAYGAVYDISCKSDGNGIFVICHSTSLREHRELLAAKGKALLANPNDDALSMDVRQLRAAVARQSELQSSVMVPGEVEKVKTRAGKLGVKPILDSDGTSFELSFGIRKAKFTLNESQFRKQWR